MSASTSTRGGESRGQSGTPLARRSASLRKAKRPSSSAFLTVFLIDRGSARASRPLHDSSVKTRVVSPSNQLHSPDMHGTDAKRAPFHTTPFALENLRRIVPGPAFHWNVVPTRTGSSTFIVFTPASIGAMS